jgi:rhodanese-related sulfurtransferase
MKSKADRARYLATLTNRCPRQRDDVTKSGIKIASLDHWSKMRIRIMPAIDTSELKSMKKRGEDFVLVNTLPEDHFEKTRIPGAINIPQDQTDFARRVKSLAGSKDQKIVVYCANIDCDSYTQAAEKLDQAGFTNVFDYRVGAKGWREDSVSQAQQER